MLTDENKDRLSTLIRERMAETRTPGLALAVVSGNQIVYATGFGVTSTDPEQAVPVTPQTVFRIGSSTKSLTGTILMRLVEAGKLSLDEPVVTYLPWFTLSDPEATKRVTLRHLMSHQSGLPWGSQFFGSRDTEGLEKYVREQVPRFPLLALPGTLFSYSNIGVNISGCVAEVVGGAPFAELMQSLVFEPLAMERSTFDPLRAISFPLAQAHEKTERGVQVRRGEPWAENVAYRPSAMAFSTVLDMASFARLHLNQGVFNGQQLLSAESVAEMHRTQVDEYQVDGRTVGLNFALTRYRGYQRVGHPGGISSFVSLFTMLPEVGVGILLQFNHSTFWHAGEEIVQHIFDIALRDAPPVHAVLDTLPVATEPDDWQRYVGTFLGTRVGLVALSVAPSGESLLLSRPGKMGKATLTPVRRDLYTGRNSVTSDEEVVGFIGTGTVTYVIVNGVPCVRVTPNPNFVLEPENWNFYSGVYEGPDETASTGRDVLTLRCQDEKLIVHSRNRARDEQAIPFDEDCFVYRERFLKFQRDLLTFTLGDEPTPYHKLTPTETRDDADRGAD